MFHVCGIFPATMRWMQVLSYLYFTLLYHFCDVFGFDITLLLRKSKNELKFRSLCFLGNSEYVVSMKNLAANRHFDLICKVSVAFLVW